MDRRGGCAVAPSCCLQPHWGSYEEVVVGARMPVHRPVISMHMGLVDQHAAEHASTLLANSTGNQLYITHLPQVASYTSALRTMPAAAA